MDKNKQESLTLENRDLYMAFYVGTYRFHSWVIKKWTKSPISHVEFYISAPKTKYDPTGLIKPGHLIGISDDSGVRVAKYDSNIPISHNSKWILVKIPDFVKKRFYAALGDMYEKTEGAKYDVWGIIGSNIFSRREHNPKKYTCSEWCANVIGNVFKDSKIEGLENPKGLLYPTWYSIFTPADIYAVMQEISNIEGEVK